MAVNNIMSIDLESWVQGHENLKLTSKGRKELDNQDTLREAEYVLDQLAKRSVKLTWYVVAELADWYPTLIDNIRNEGHEIGYHTHDHHMTVNRQIVEQQLKLSADFHKEYRPVSYQAPEIVFCEDGYKFLEEYGFKYSLSVYGHTSQAYMVDGVLECPVSVYYFRQDKNPVIYPSGMNRRLLTHGIPFGSSFWYAMGYRFIDLFVSRFNKNGRFVNMFVHNWQLYPASKRARRAKWKFCFYRNPALVMYLPNVERIFFELMDNYQWGRAKDILKDTFGHLTGG